MQLKSIYMRKEKSVNNINFEKDAKQDLASANDAKQLSDQVVKLQNLEEQIGEREKERESEHK